MKKEKEDKLKKDEETPSGAAEDITAEGEEPSAEGEAPAETEKEMSPEEAVAVLLAEAESFKEQLTEKEDQYLRLHAEFDNFRRRTLKEKDDLRKTANADLLSALLPVLDNFDRALVHAEDSPILEGIVMVQKQMMEILGNAGLKKIGEPGEDFDPNFHDGIMQEEKEGAKADTILEVLQPGYQYHDKLLRAAMVKVAK